MNATRQVRWDWGLYLVASDGQLLPLRPEVKQGLKLLPSPRLQRDTVFLVPPGRQRLRLLVEGYVGVRYSMAYTPFIINSLQHDATLDLQPGQEIRFPLP